LRKGKLVFVDLAGSERLKRSKNSDAEETGAINKSLFTLAKVISLLADHADNVLKETANHNHSVAAAARWPLRRLKCCQKAVLEEGRRRRQSPTCTFRIATRC